MKAMALTIPTPSADIAINVHAAIARGLFVLIVLFVLMGQTYRGLVRHALDVHQEASARCARTG
jgi:hypothetical protein